jgi:hypothetical protein
VGIYLSGVSLFKSHVIGPGAHSGQGGVLRNCCGPCRIGKLAESTWSRVPSYSRRTTTSPNVSLRAVSDVRGGTSRDLAWIDPKDGPQGIPEYCPAAQVSFFFFLFSLVVVSLATRKPPGHSARGSVMRRLPTHTAQLYLKPSFASRLADCQPGTPSHRVSPSPPTTTSHPRNQ